MPASRATLAVVVVPLLFACSSTPQQTTQASMAAEPCVLAGIQANTCVRSGMQRVCHAFVGVRAGKIFIFPQELQSGRGVSGDRERVIVWHLVTPQVVFKPEDGPLELKSEAEFKDWGPTDDFGGAIQNQPEARHYRIGFKNSSVKPDGFKYTIQLTRPDGTKLACDPKITNDSD